MIGSVTRSLFTQCATLAHRSNGTSFLAKRSFLTGRSLQNIADSPLAQLRKKTGLAYSLCKKALDQHNNDIEAAEKWLKEESVKHGWQKSTSLQGRKTKEGLIGVYVDPKLRHHAALVEILCETDFVSRNENFRNFVTDITRNVSATNDLPALSQENSGNADADSPMAMRKINIDVELIKSLYEDKLFDVVSRLGEKIKLSRAAILSLPPDSPARLYAYMHSTGTQNDPDLTDVLVGKYGSVVSIRNLDENPHPNKLSNVGKHLCQHIIGLKPTSMGSREAPEPTKDSEKESSSESETSTDNSTSTSSSSSEAQDDEDSSAEDYLSEFEDEEYETLLDQGFILNPKMSVREYLEKVQVSVEDYWRFECGELEESS